MFITILIIISTAIISVYGFNNRELFYKLSFSPYQTYHRKEWYRILSHGFLHADWSHLIFNMFTLFFFGPVVERSMQSPIGFLVFYLTAIVVSSLTTLFKQKENYYYNSIGASGAVSAVLFATVLYSPMSRIMIFPIPIPIPAIIYAIFYLVYSQYMSKRNSDNINHDAHFLGAVYGFIVPLLFQPSLFLDFIGQIFR